MIISHLYKLTLIVTIVMVLGLVCESQSFDDLDRDRDRGEICIVSPGEGDKLVAGSKQKISWQISGTIQYVKIEYSTTSGRKWVEIVKSERVTAPVQSYDWEVPCTPTSKGKVRVSDPYGPASDVSFKTFSISCDKAKPSAEKSGGH